MKPKHNFSLFPIILMLTAVSAATGWLDNSLYAKEVLLMSVKSRANDIVLLFIITPIGFVLYYLVRKGDVWAKLLTLGILSYLLFFIGFNAFNLQFNRFFLLYLAIISLCSFTILQGVPEVLRSIHRLVKLPLKRLVCISLFFIAITGLGFWLSEVIPATINGSVPASINKLNLPVNAACVFDLAFMMPLMIIGAIKLWRGQVIGLVISVIMLSWLVLTSISVISMEFGLKLAGLDLDVGKMIGIGFNGLLSGVMLFLVMKHAEIK